MRRADFLKITGLTVQKFDTRLSRSELPFWWVGSRVDERENGWGNYSPFDAFLTIQTGYLAERGPGLAEASAALRALDGRLKADWPQIASDTEGHDYLVMWARIDCPEAGHPPFTETEVFQFAGTLESCTRQLRERFGQRRIQKLSAVDTYEAVRLLRRLALENEISIDPAF